MTEKPTKGENLDDERLNPGPKAPGVGGAGASRRQHRKREEDDRFLRTGKVYSGTQRDSTHIEEDE